MRGPKRTIRLLASILLLAALVEGRAQQDDRDLAVAPEEPAFVPEEPVLAPNNPVVVPEEPVLTPQEPVIAPEEVDFEPEEPDFVPEELTFAPEEPAFVPEELTFAPEEPAFVPEELTFVPEEPAFVPEELTFVPQEPTLAHEGSVGPEESSLLEEDQTVDQEEQIKVEVKNSPEEVSSENNEETKPQVEGGKIDLQTPSGPIFGKEAETDAGTRFYTFKGIPYAEAPLGKLRFKDPVRKRAWKEELNATEYGPRCVQASFVPGQPVWGSEDCLTLNVFSPRIPNSSGRKLPRSSLLPVMVYIHGGGFTLGAGSDAEGDLFMDKEVLFVTLNYRLGALGFLSMGNRYIAGNMGLKDQLVALQWIQANIHAFGGDSQKVTLFGESVGAFSTALHQASSKGNGLYRNVIAMSGSALYRHYGFTNGVAYSEGRRFIKEVGCENELLAGVIECLETKDVAELAYLQASPNFTTVREADENGEGFYKWVPTIDAHSVNPLLPFSPLELLKSGQQKDIPTIIGVVKNEGAFQGDPLFDQVDEINENFDFHGPSNIYIVGGNDITDEHKLVSGSAQHFYNGVDKNFTEENKYGLFNFFTDSYFFSSSHKSAKLQSKQQKAPVYMYEITGKASASVGSLYFPGTTIGDIGPAHADDLFFLFKNVGGLNGLASEEAKATSEKMLTLWTNFAKYNDPTPIQTDDLPTWKTFSAGSENYLEIKPEPEMRKGFEPLRMFFWEKMFWEPLERAMAANQVGLPFIPGF